MRWNLQNCRIVGSMGGLGLSSPFGRGAVVLANEREDDALMILGREGPDGWAEGEWMTDAEWRALLECEEAFALAQPIDARSGAKCWLLRAAFPRRDGAAKELRSSAVVLHEEERDGVLIFVVDESRAAQLLGRWSRDAFDVAWWLGQRGQWESAVVHADLSWLMDRSFHLDRVALLALAFELTEGASAAEDLIVVEVNSRRGRPERELRQLIAEYRSQFPLVSRLAPSLAARMRELESDDRIGNIESWQAKRATTDRVFPHPRPTPRAPSPRAA